ncbi:STY4851/ECs_5259 family protein [Pasteurella multocida]|uniref:STY4851/ECs_5259 family protein n=1 Tax=Pasteurella multocida TaxID=747 RepID=UPI002C0DE201|nr:STY4851/ECs_5259 family protein [Pasteurella multocida]MEB3466764.1 STY4851/ECs_5259 family protein [Pasteurella multocida]MEB3493283.1 STY4851/ECs_5259 family protein [Pasteurella multocida]
MHNKTTQTSIYNWLSQYLMNRDLTIPDGRPLYQYRVTQKEFNDISVLLAQSYKEHINKSWCAVFCLYCSEWYRRDYKGIWSWEGIYQSLDLKLDSNTRAEVIKKGLTYWQRPVIQYSTNRHNYLGSVFREGGLPYELLVAENNRFHKLFREILELYRQNQQFVLNPKLLLPYLAYFPEYLKEETTLSLIINMVAKLAYLVDEYELSDRKNPADYLDRILPNWKESFPIPLTGEDTNQLLFNLLDSTVKEKTLSIKKGERYSLTQILTEIERLQFKVSLKLAKNFSFQPQKELTQEQLIISLYEGNHLLKNISSAYLQQNNSKSENSTIMLRQEHIECARKDPTKQLSLVINQKGQIVYQEFLAESAINIDEMPLVLSDEAPYKVIGSGSVSKKTELLYLIVKASAEITDEEHSESILDKSYDGFNCYLIEGKIRVNYQNEQFYISTCHEGLKSQLRLIGKTLPYFTTTGNPIYLGLPKLAHTIEEFKLRIGDGQNTSMCYGEQYARILDQNDNLIFKQKVAILPEDFCIKLCNTDSPKEGIIECYCTSPFVIKTLDPWVDSQIIQNISNNRKSLQVSCKDIPKTLLKLEIRVDLFSSIHIELPFPSSGALILAQDGKEIPISKLISIQELLGCRLYLYPHIDTATAYEIDIKNGKNNRLYFNYKVDDSPLEVNLYNFKPDILSLLSALGNLDDQIKFIISRNNQEIEQLNIQHYSIDLNIKDNIIQIINNSQYAKEYIKLELLSLTNLTLKELNINECGDYLLPSEIDSPSLIISSKSALIQSRSCFIQATIPTYDSLEELQSAIVQPEETYQYAVKNVLNKMEKDFNHSGWGYLTKLYNDFNYLPLPTFLIWKELVKHSKALISFVIKTTYTEQVMQKLQTEYNVLWKLTPRYIWLEKLEQFKKSLTDLPEEIINQILKTKTDKIKFFTPIYKQTKEKVPFNQMKDILKFWYQELHRKHIDQDYWLSDFSEELESWAKDNNIVLEFINDRAHNAVCLFPFFAAAVATGKANIDTLGPMTDQDFYTFKMLMDFDSDWFNPVYDYAIQFFEEEY